ncbi:hydrolase [Prochlorococcus sp. MIT 1307]|uniref:hydrolase n=1 Tax=Prochlorococcus sp. MIT 1307 TaxID=3096219 RepID=UPI002A7642CB|nr:hydrolase [Prochlorococcus sp. MIT 1307]
MAPLRMKEKSTAIIVIDVQEKLAKAIENKDDILFNIRKLIDAGIILNIPQFFTEQNPHKLGETVKLLGDYKNKNTFSKMSFSCFKCSALINKIENLSLKNILLCGVETHICVQQTALDFIANGFNVFIAADSVGSRNNIDHITALRRLEKAGAIISTTESIIFEWCRNAERSEFKGISELIKRRKG